MRRTLYGVLFARRAFCLLRVCVFVFVCVCACLPLTIVRTHFTNVASASASARSSLFCEALAFRRIALLFLRARLPYTIFFFLKFHSIHIVCVFVFLCSDARTQKAISQSLVDIGMRQPNLVVSTAFDFLVNDKKHSKGHRVQLLEVLERVLNERRDKLSF